MTKILENAKFVEIAVACNDDAHTPTYYYYTQGDGHDSFYFYEATDNGVPKMTVVQHTLNGEYFLYVEYPSGPVWYVGQGNPIYAIEEVAINEDSSFDDVDPHAAHDNVEGATLDRLPPGAPHYDGVKRIDGKN